MIKIIINRNFVQGERREHDTGSEPCTFCGFGNRNCYITKGKNFNVVCNGGQTPNAHSKMNITNRPIKCKLCSSYYYLINEAAHYSTKHAGAKAPEQTEEVCEILEKVFQRDKNKKTRKRLLISKKRTLKTTLKQVSRTVRGKNKAVVTFQVPVPLPIPKFE